MASEPPQTIVTFGTHDRGSMFHAVAVALAAVAVIVLACRLLRGLYNVGVGGIQKLRIFLACHGFTRQSSNVIHGRPSRAAMTTITDGNGAECVPGSNFTRPARKTISPAKRASH